MLESLVTWVLNNYLGKYVENLNTDQLSIALLSGEVELENLPLRKDALRHLGVPIEIKAGYIGKVKLQIPIRSLRSSPWVINLSGLYLIAGPLNLDEWDQSAEELADQERKLSNLDALEAAWRLETDQNLFPGVNTTHYATSYSSWLQFGSGLITNIIENMQLNINNVHFRFEDSCSLNYPEISVCGLTIESISAQSCDENFVPQYSSGSDLSFKTIKLKNLAVYWDSTNVNDLTSNLPISDLVQVLSDLNPENHCYLIAPVSACAKLQRNCSELPLRSPNTPRIICDLNLDQVPIILIDWQYKQMVSCLHGLDFVSRVQHYRRHRPSVPVSSDPKAWWGYAVLCHVPGALRRRPSWGEALERAQQNVQYVEMCTKLLVQPSGTLTGDEKKLKDLVEWSRDYLELRALREVAMRRCPYNPPTPQVPQNTPQTSYQGRSILARWFPQYWGWYSTPVEPSESSVDPGSVADPLEVIPNATGSRQLEDEILEALADSAKNNTILRRDTVFGRFNFTLNGGMMELRASQEVGEKGVSMLDLQFSDLLASIISRPRSSSFSLELRLGVLELRDRLTTGTLFPVLVGPPNMEPAPLSHTQRQNFRQRIRQDLQSPHPFFTLTYSFSNSINSLTVTSLPLDVVYHPQAARWLLDFLSAPHQNSTTRTRLEAVRARTKQLTDSWGRQILERDRENVWEIKLDISAPQIIFVEKITDPSSAIAVVDLGTLLLQNTTDIKTQLLQKQNSESGDESENFMTPCSTPPGSEASIDDPRTLISSLNEQSIHQRLYDTYNIELNDIQILIGKIRDNWRHAHTKGSSNLHVLDRFNIFLTLERRVVPTNDNNYPSLTLNANLPRLVAHINEQKISSMRNLIKIISDSNIESPFQNSSPRHEIQTLPDSIKNQETPTEMSDNKLVTLQFTIEQMSLEVQSRGRSVAELQVSGITLSLFNSSPTLHLSLSILSLLLVDALQTSGPGFELLVASHRLVVMDTASGEIRDSEPCSPVSPGSPTGAGSQQGSPEQLAKALEASGALQNEDLIYGEYTIDKNDEGNVQVVAVRFSNLDIIANQETIVELMGFVRRVFPPKTTRVQIPPPVTILDDDLTSKLSKNSSISGSNESLDIKSKIELNFDFHRLNVLLLRGSVEEGRTVGRKIATMTMSDAKIEATVDKEVFIRGSLGGLQILDLIGKSLHQRIVSVGKDPLAEDFQSNSDKSNKNLKQFFDLNEQTAFSFQIKRSLCSDSPLILTCHLASVWYTHSHLFLGELHSCAAEFKQYLADLARSIRSAATDVALGLVHSRTELLAQTLYARAGLGVDIQSPRKRRRSIGSIGSLGSESQTPFSPEEDDDSFTGINIQLDIILDSPVLVLPRSSTSPHVLVGHLGKITISNNSPISQNYNTYDIVIKDMSICTLDTTHTRTDNTVQRVESLYNCNTGLPILHDTLLKLQVVKTAQSVIENGFLNKLSEENNLERPAGDLEDLSEEVVNGKVDYFGVNDVDNHLGYANYEDGVHLKITGSVVNDLRVSLTRGQYEQLLDTLQWLSKHENKLNPPGESLGMAVIVEEEAAGVSTLSMDPHVRAKMFPSVNKRRGGPTASTSTEETSFLKVGVRFTVASFEVKLCGQHDEGLVGLSFGEFLLTWCTSKKWESELQVSLRSLLVEDLLSERGSFGRQMISSKDDNDSSPLIPPCISKSFPESHLFTDNFEKFASLPDHLDTREIFGLRVPKIGVGNSPRILKGVRLPHRCRGHDLVLVTSKFVDPNAPNFKTDYNEVRKTTCVDLGSIDVVVSAKSWIPLLEFFRVTNQDENEDSNNSQNLNLEDKKYNSSTSFNFNSLTVQILHNFSNLARAKISGAHLDIFRKGPLREFQGHLGALQVRHPGKENFSCRGERFVTIGDKSLDFCLKIDNTQSDLCLEISPFVYVHTKRFIAEIRAFFREFYNENDEQFSKKDSNQKISKMNLKITTNSCITLFPISVSSPNLLVLEISKLIVSNVYAETEISRSQPLENAQIDITKWNLFEVDFYTAKATERPLLVGLQPIGTQEIIFGDCCVQRTSQSLLKEKGMLEIRVDKNVHPKMSHRKNNVPDMAISCQLSTLEIFLNLQEYALIRDVLSQNLGEDTELILPTYISNTNVENDENFIISSLRIELLDVKLHLQDLTCINFIKSRLVMDSYSDLKQDIDLVSRQILIIDSRREKQNIYTEILKPIKNSSDVQCEIHSRRFLDKNKFTILLNNMQLLAISDWWVLMNNFIFTNFEFSDESDKISAENNRKVDIPFELKLNITESEIVVLEDFTKDETNAVILRSTTLVTYRPNQSSVNNMCFKPLQISVNHLELFSCRFLSTKSSQTLLEDTALSIIDPVTISGEVSQNILEIQLHDLTIRVSYRDILLFTAILDSFRRQTVQNRHENKFDTFSKDVEKLKSLGFSESDCLSALKICKQLEDAALWLTQNAVAKHVPTTPKNGLEIKNIELRASIIRFCLIDDCKDVDVPLLEVCLNNLTLNYDLGCSEPNQEPILGQEHISGPKTASIEATLSLDYYNRVLGGWEPFLEPWKCRAIWKPENTLTTYRNRVALHSDDILDLNITDSFLNLVTHVKENWLNDFQGPKSNPRSPFVPYSLRNDTGSILYFATVVSDPDEPVRSIDREEFDYEKHKNLKWIEVQPGVTTPFSYHSRHSKQRHAETHQLRSHQLCVRVFGWQACFPVTVDQVGVYFRGANPDRGAEPYRITAPRSARIVFEVKLDGSARKLVIVRSAMVLVNKLKDPVDVKLVERSAVNAVSTSSRSAILQPSQQYSLPLIHCHSHIFVRPSSENLVFSYSQPDIPWSRICRPNERGFFPLRCTTNRGAPYFLCCEIKREKYPIGDVGHSIILIPMLLLVNLLPQDLFFSITSFSETEVNTVVNKGRILPGQHVNISSADTDSNLEINFWIESFKCISGLKISATQPGFNECTMDYTTRIRLQDSKSRDLCLTSRIESWCGARLRVSCWAPWLLRSRAGLPIILKAGGAPLAGQSADHEIARALAPLPFSLEEDQGGIALTARIGNRYLLGSSQDCAPFYLKRGTQVRRLRVLRNGQPDAVFVLAIEVKPRPITSLVTISPRHQLCNRSCYWLEFAQQCDVELQGTNRVCAPPGCYLPFHFPNLDSPLLLSIRLTSPPPHKPLTLWSGGVRLESPQSYHLPLFEPSVGLSPTRWGFLHADVTFQGPTLCLVVSETGALPPEIRIDNYSEVAVLVRQANEGRQTRAALNGAQTVHARASVPYAWPEPCGAHRLLVEGPGGQTVSVDLKKMETVTLAYENFNYLAFTGTFNTEDDLDQYDESVYSSHNFKTYTSSKHKNISSDHVRSQRLVLDVPEGSTDVILAKKQPGKRSQLFRVTTSGLLEHIASSSSNNSLVLDIGALSPRPSAPPPRLSLRRPDPRRRSTQTWRFAPDGRLCCAHRNTCVQSPDGILGLRPGSFAVLGPTRECPSYRTVHTDPSVSTPNFPAGVLATPIEQQVGKQKMRPGSGLLSIDVTTDGPTRVVRIQDLKFRELGTLGCFDEDWKGVASLHKPTTNNFDDKNLSEYQITLMLRSGLGVSIIGAKRELIYLQFNNIIAEAIFGAKSQEFCISVQDTQIDNQISNQYPVLLYATKTRSHSEQTRVQNLPIIELRAVLSPSTGSVLIFKHLIVCLRPLSIHLEESLLLRMYEFFYTALGKKIEIDDVFSGSKLDEDLSDLAIATPQENLTPLMRYHFGIIRLVPGPIRLSVHTALSGSLTPRLRAIKRRLGLTLIGIEDAPLEVEPYVRHLPFETGEGLIASIMDHLRDEMLWQAAALLGSVDFLGNPIGLLGDVSEGVSGLIRERSVGALVANVAHGLSNSAAKVTETLGDGLGRVTMDESHEEMRQRIRRRGGSSTSSGAHLVAGLKGLGFGVLGGATGIFKQVYEGASNEGLQGVFSGLGKGLVGAVAKPVVGVLDLATETARAVRDSSRGSSRAVPSRRRPIRSPRGTGGLLPLYNPKDSLGQSYLEELLRTSTINSDEIENQEFYVSYESVRSGTDDLRVIVSSRRVYVVTGSNPELLNEKKLTVVTETRLSELVKCSYVTQHGKFYIEMTVKGQSLRRPLIRCDNEEISRAVTRQINYAKRLYEEATHTLPNPDD